MRLLTALSVGLILASALAHADARKVSVRVLDAKDRPVPGIDLLLCKLGSDKCFEAATTDARGTAHFEKAPREIALVRFMPTAELCVFTQERIDLRAEGPISAVLRLPPRGNLRVRLLEHQKDGSTKPLRTNEFKVMTHPSPALPHGAGQSTYWPKSPTAKDRFEICVDPQGAYDVEVEIPGFYLGSTHAPAPAPGETVEISITVRRKPAS
jgi:hypothetical protein